MSVPPLFVELFDDAALFPPGSAAMPDAVTDHLGRGPDQRPELAALTGRFVCPAARLAELDAELAGHRSGPVAVSLTVPAGPAGLAQAVTEARGLAGIDLQAIELPVAAGELAGVQQQLRALAADGLQVFVEVPVEQVDFALTALLAGAGLGLKLRTGGTVAEAFPTVPGLAAALTAVASATAPAKCTAGLHNAIGHTDTVTGFEHHGFLNVLLAVQAAGTGTDPAAALAERSPARLLDLLAALTESDISVLRERFRSIGSCSIAEPLTDLEELGLVKTG